MEASEARQKVLMIDNAKTMHAVARARLAEDAVDFHSAYGGEEGLAMAKALRPDVILLDVEMPVMNGFEVCKRLKSDAALSTIPVVFLTALSSTQEKVRGLNLGAVDYIAKPCDGAELQARVRANLRTKELLDLLSRKAMIDGLTGLWNRSYFDQRVTAEVSQSRRYHRPLSCVMADVDEFKAVNDTHGHGFGDLVLRGVAGTVQRHCRSEDVMCRCGGEEFAILTPGTEGAGAAAFAERLRAAVAAQTFTRNGVSVSVTCSFGVAEVHLDTETRAAAEPPAGPDGLVERADRALYQSKRAGRNRVTFESPGVRPGTTAVVPVPA